MVADPALRNPQAVTVRNEVRRRSLALVAELDLPEPFDMDEFCRALGRRRGRPLHRVAANLPTGSPSGMWVATPDADYVFFEQRTTALHQRHIVLHELGHLISNHDAPPAMTDATSQALLPHLDPSMVRRMLGRTYYSVVEEQQAELVASLVHERISAWAPEPTWAVDPEVADLVARLERAFRG
jgi:hypothetical protein